MSSVFVKVIVQCPFVFERSKKGFKHLGIFFRIEISQKNATILQLINSCLIPVCALNKQHQIHTFVGEPKQIIISLYRQVQANIHSFFYVAS